MSNTLFFNSKPVFDRKIITGEGILYTEATIAEMIRLSVKGSRDPLIRLTAIEIIQGIPGRKHHDIAERLFYWLQDKGKDIGKGIKFINDPWLTEQATDPVITLLATGVGDCNSAHSIAIASLLMSMGIPAFFRTYKINPQYPDQYTHVAPIAVMLPGKGRLGLKSYTLPLDTSVPFTKPGDQPKFFFESKDWLIDPSKFEENSRS